jgi:hypothetical protein
VQRRLGEKGVTVSASAAPSTPLDIERRGLSEVVRASGRGFATQG